ncbi:hypothetical protein Calkr_0696 [Caldicellulosiruptor acetigenus I77R1B]|uniref:Uncharacterized protein n=2 Tax=Caldicellulosiruptor acetigenus TaxID=301953 RepID=G2PT87_9FIRM|nr:hypothetical protein [Caldicellulosiruptor acetigenus]ADQ40228.1 hypothetical protein Calkr_0696 [Caldicellulosiruptor acetigenus I77R1B]AEM74246.1 hypothetical protein Calla_1647 [Caldicellulosiruptor acetigenus 6A]
MKKIKAYTLRLPEEHPFWREENKSEVAKQALDIYYAVKLFTSGIEKSESPVKDTQSDASKQSTENKQISAVNSQDETIKAHEIISNGNAENSEIQGRNKQIVWKVTCIPRNRRIERFRAMGKRIISKLNFLTRNEE